VDGVVAAKVALGREISCPTSEPVIDADDQRGGVKRLEFSHDRPVGGCLEAPVSMSCGQDRPGLGIGQDTDSRRMARAPQPDGDFGPILLDEKLDQRRGVEVEGQRR
jgi:hypothetical protein